jgi:hypothetical protein
MAHHVTILVFILRAMACNFPQEFELPLYCSNSFKVLTLAIFMMKILESLFLCTADNSVLQIYQGATILTPNSPSSNCSIAFPKPSAF